MINKNPEGETRRHSPVVELREYTLHPGTRETLIEVFDRHFVEGQEGTGLTIIGQFRDPDRPDRFVWLRGFETMEARKEALAAFYGGPIWAAHRDVANATMISSDNVLLLKPAWAEAGFDLAGRTRGPREAVDSHLPARDVSGPIVLATIHHLRPESSEDLVAIFQREAVPLLAKLGAPAVAAFVSEDAENTFPPLPVREGENVLVTFQEFAGTAELARYQEVRDTHATWQVLETKLAPHRAREVERFRLMPTARSLVGGKRTN